MTNTALFWPAFVLATATMALYPLTFVARKKLVERGVAKVSHYRTYENEVPESRLWHNAIANQFETPVLFYAACGFTMIMGRADGVTLALAWGFAIVKCVHMGVHIFGNRIRYRAPVFGLALLILLMFWAWLALGAL